MERIIKCTCGNWESFPADQQRWSSQNFDWIKNTENNNALYQCKCGKSVESTVEEEEEETYFTCCGHEYTKEETEGGLITCPTCYEWCTIEDDL